MNRPDTLREMESLLASIREAIESHTGQGRAASVTQAQDAAQFHQPRQEHAAATSQAQPELDWQTTAGDDDILWADESVDVADSAHHALASSRHESSHEAAMRAETSDEALNAHAAVHPHEGVEEGAAAAAAARVAAATQATGDNLVRPAWAVSSSTAPASTATAPDAPAMHAARATSAGVTAARPASSRRAANLRLVKSDAAETSPAREEAQSVSSRSSFLSREVRDRVRAAMERQKRIEEAKRALGGEEALRQLVRDIIEPIIAEWLNEHLAEIVERRVARELARLREGGE